MRVSDVITKLKITEYVTSTNPNPSILRDIDMSDLPIGSDIPLSSGSGVNSIVMSGYDNEASGEASVALGVNVQATNTGELAIGQYNKSNPSTQLSVGIGGSDNDRKNALEITNDGKVYVNGVGEYDGSNIDVASDLQTVLDDKETIRNKVQSLSTESTEEQYPSAKCVYDKIANLVAADEENEILKITY